MTRSYETLIGERLSNLPNLTGIEAKQLCEMLDACNRPELENVARKLLAERLPELNAWGKYYMAKVLATKGEYKEALVLLESAYPMAFSNGDGEYMCKTNALLSTCHESMGNIKEALACLKKYTELLQKAQGKTIGELKVAQDRLVQQEKLVSLGRMLTGIAHELQNPLNFVTNFASLSLELADELREVTDLEERKEIRQDIVDNLHRINTHGIRASGIVKGMLELNRDGRGLPQPVALSRLVDEFVSLTWNNYRSKCPDLKVNILIAPVASEVYARVISMDVGRAIISIVNNALDAVVQSAAVHGAMYMPTIKVSLTTNNNKAVIAISDNGQGISYDKLTHIFEPFYTTKSTSHGNVGLGLSLAHDMVAAQGGTIAVESELGFGATFSIILNLAELDDE